MKKRKNAIGCLLLLACLFGAAFRVNASEIEEPQNLYAKAAVLLDADSGRVLFEKNGNERMPMASTTKIMTCIVALENGNLEEEVTVSAYAASMPKVKLYIKAGEKYQLKDLLYSLMLESHNDAAVAIAEHIGGSVDAFANMMNQKARDIGCNNTFFITPNGLDATATITETSGKTESKIHSTTAAELAKIMAYCIKRSPQKEMFLEITRTPSYAFSDLAQKRSFHCNNHNAFLGMMEGALSGKTGFTGNAGYCYVGALEREGKTFVVALLACGWPNNKSYKWSDTKKMMNYALEAYEFSCFEDESNPIEKWEPIFVKNAQTIKIGEKAYVPITLSESTHVKGKEDCRGLLLKKGEEIERNIVVKKSLEAPVQKGEKVGSIEYLVNGEIWRVKQIVTDASLNRIDYNWCLKKMVEKILL